MIKGEFPESTTNDTYGQYQTNEYQKTHLPQLPRVMKNRYLERARQRLNTSSEEYGRFWATGPPPGFGLGPSRPVTRALPPNPNQPAGLSSLDMRRDRPFKKLSNMHQLESNSFWNRGSNSDSDNLQLDDIPTGFQPKPDFRLPDTTTWRSVEENYLPDIEPTPRMQWDGPDTARPLPAILKTQRTGDPKSTDLDRYMEKYKLSVGIDRNALNLPDIKYIDLHLHLQNNSTVTIKAVPFSLE